MSDINALLAQFEAERPADPRKRCSVCEHPMRELIETLRGRGVPCTQIERFFLEHADEWGVPSVSDTIIRRHEQRHHGR